jgi:hypothetical protein
MRSGQGMLQKIWSCLHQVRLSLFPTREESLSDCAAAPAEISYVTPHACETSPSPTLPRNPTVPTVIDDEAEASMQYPGYTWNDTPKSYFDGIIL